MYIVVHIARVHDPSEVQVELGLGLGFEEVFVVDRKSENRDRAVQAVGLGLGLEPFYKG